MLLMKYFQKIFTSAAQCTAVEWEDLTSQLSLQTLKRNASAKLEHLLSAATKVLTFFANDENDLTIKSDFNNVQKYVVRSLSQMD